METAKSHINGTLTIINNQAWIAVNCAEKSRKTVDGLRLITYFGKYGTNAIVTKMCNIGGLRSVEKNLCSHISCGLLSHEREAEWRK